MKFVKSVASDTARVTAWVDGRQTFMIQTDDGELLLPVMSGLPFALWVQNLTDGLRAFPAVVGNGQDWLNVYAACPITDPSLMPSTGGMWECRPYDNLKIDAFALPNSQQRPFIINGDGLGYQDLAANQIKVWERPPADPNATLNEWDASGLVARSTTRGSGPVIGAGAVRPGQRVLSHLDYLEAQELACVRLIGREEAIHLLVAAGIEVSSWYCHGAPADLGVELRVSR